MHVSFRTTTGTTDRHEITNESHGHQSVTISGKQPATNSGEHTHRQWSDQRYMPLIRPYDGQIVASLFHGHGRRFEPKHQPDVLDGSTRSALAQIIKTRRQKNLTR